MVGQSIIWLGVPLASGMEIGGQKTCFLVLQLKIFARFMRTLNMLHKALRPRTVNFILIYLFSMFKILDENIFQILSVHIIKYQYILIIRENLHTIGTLKKMTCYNKQFKNIIELHKKGYYKFLIYLSY